MPAKEELLTQLMEQPADTLYTRHNVKCLLDSVRREVDKPSHLKLGDVYLQSVGTKKRPVVIIRVVGELVLGIPLSSTEDSMNLMPQKSRFFGGGFFSKHVVTATNEYALQNFAGVFDNEKQVRKAIRLMKQFYKEVL